VPPFSFILGYKIQEELQLNGKHQLFVNSKAGITEAESLSPLTQKLTILHLSSSEAFEMFCNPEHVTTNYGWPYMKA
jgi:hypothetical protein